MDFAQQQRNPAKHIVGLAVVVALHVVVGWALVNGLARKVIEVVKAPIETKIIEEVKPAPPPPENLPPPPKSLPPPPSFVPPPEVVVTPPPVPQPAITATVVPPPPTPVVVAPATPAPEAPPAAGPMAVRPAIVDIRSCAPTADDYPTAAKRADATGITKIRFTIDGDGKLQKIDVIKSAGSSREHRMLDRLAHDKLSQCRFTAGTDAAGRAVGGTFDFEYVWKLQ